LLFNAASVFSQTKKIDSLKLLLVNAKEDTIQFRIYYNIAGEYWSGLKDTIDFVNTFKYEDSAYRLAKKLNYKYGEFDCLMCYANVTAYQKKNKRVQEIFKRSCRAYGSNWKQKTSGGCLF
jgi:hypothetical protein